MQRALLSAVERLEIEAVQAHQPAAGEARVAVAACGICGSDLHTNSSGECSTSARASPACGRAIG
jgi:D-arabinose 1-dehydrogenase-like Zn-dependent alcohol dehydrogenase